MKKLTALFITFSIILFTACSNNNNDGNRNDVLINAENFPDENFRNYILEQDYGSDNLLSNEEIAQITEINLRDKNISDLTGIEYFTALEKLECFGNKLKMLDISKNTAITTLHCWTNQLTSLNVSKNTELTELSCLENELTILDISKNNKLINLYCFNNKLTTLNLSENTKLEHLNCYGNQLGSLDVSKNTTLNF